MKLFCKMSRNWFPHKLLGLLQKLLGSLISLQATVNRGLNAVIKKIFVFIPELIITSAACWTYETNSTYLNWSNIPLGGVTRVPRKLFQSLHTFFNTIMGLSAADKIVCISLLKYLPQLSTYFHDSCVAPRPERYIIPINQIWHAFTADEVESLNGLGKVIENTQHFESYPHARKKIQLPGDIMGLRSQVVL